ncbi:hypothetical protein [Streptomyces sp. BH055]|uniref:hypothetical protein n=1 Tax=Streptomyces sp. BH055 TaxID=3401173 RepID=UPI003BB6EDA6
MSVISAILWGAAGGVLSGLIFVWDGIASWRLSRENGEDRAPLSKHFDLLADSLAALIRAIFGAGAAGLLAATGQISGVFAAIGVGVAAPALLDQVGKIGAVSSALSGTGEGSPSAEDGVPAEELDAFLKQGERELRKLDSPSTHEAGRGEVA